MASRFNSKQIASTLVKKAVQSYVKKKFKFTTLLIAAVIAFLILVLLAIIIVVSILVSNQTEDSFVSQKILPPQIYVQGLKKHITSPYGYRTHPITKKKTLHSGIDIGVPEGTPVQSSTAGTVETVKFPMPSDPASTQNAGIFVVISNPDPQLNLKTRYLHLSQVFVNPGDTVEAGQIIGLSGNTGRSTGAHLHFETIPDGKKAVNPVPYINTISEILDISTKEAMSQNIPITLPASSDARNYESPKMLYVNQVIIGDQAGSGGSGGGSSAGGGTSSSVPYIPDLPPPNVPGIDKMNPFVQRYASLAIQEQKRTGIFASVTLAQAGVESSFGAHNICNNLYGIKADSRWRGPVCKGKTTEQEKNGKVKKVVAPFRSYSSFEESIIDHSNFLLQNSRYKTALSQKNPYDMIRGIARAGYATNLKYEQDTTAMMRNQNLTIFDNGGIDPTTGKPYVDTGGMNLPIGEGGGGSSSQISPGDILADLQADTITVVYGVAQYYGNSAVRIVRSADGGVDKYPMEYDGRPIINLVNYNNVVQLSQYAGKETRAPEIQLASKPAAITVTLKMDKKKKLYVANVSTNTD
ncbi:glucosaminidase domain-containing protein [Paenibacillus sp. A3M_27_13]|uniref:glucosaminidase domain-containing protein n=1 Tax=Paenibacillus sp. A3M_27_13 TaxID=2962029 RepID=UPI0020B8933A|nr:glucosaminidase domain-containing protein [Paenibacillus sp. A3M_27_13]MCP3746644.1 peptidoglycan DD-metalloendopeptidase family protein [Paenibacillus sp. A3M_27_13]